MGNCGVCKEEKEARGTAIVIKKKKKKKRKKQLNKNTALLRDYLEAQTIRLTPSSTEAKLTFLSTAS